MDRQYWHRQTPEEPLYPDLLWSRPENKKQAGKLLIAGGSSHGFAAPAEAYAQSLRAGVGLTRVLLPQSVKRQLPPGLALAMEFAPHTPSGSFARQALAELLDASQWADGTLLAGDFGRNSETAIMLEQFVEKYSGQLTFTQDAADYISKSPQRLLQRPDSCLVISFAQLQKIATTARFTAAFTFNMGYLRLVDALHEFTGQHQTAIITKHLDTIFVASNGQVSTTKLDQDQEIWRVKTAAQAAVWWLQNPSKTFEALTSSVVA